MKKMIILKTLAAFAVPVFLTACGGGGGGTSTPATTSPTSSTQNQTTVTSSGAVSRFGSVYVNGVRYETTNSQVISEDDGSVIISNPSDEELQNIIGLGQVITVNGTKDSNGNGVANTISFDLELLGEVTAIDAANASLTILGQTIAISPDTFIDDSIIEAFRGTEIPNDLPFSEVTETLDQLISLGMILEVSGFPTPNGFSATRIEDVSNEFIGGNFEAEIKGTVSDLSATQFTLNGLTVNYEASDLDTEDFANTALANGQFVEVNGAITGPTSLDASSIELEDDRFDDDLDFDNYDEFEIEGIISAIEADSNGPGGTITINGVSISVSDISVFSVGMHLEVEGEILSDNSINIYSIEDEDNDEDTIRIEDQVVGSDSTSLQTRLGLNISLSTRTELEDDRVDDDNVQSISDFLLSAVNASVEARGFPLDNQTVWTEVEILDENETSCRLRGPVENITGDSSSFSFTIEGITVDTDQVADNDFESGNDLVIGKSAFFDALTEGDIVQAESDELGVGCTNGTLTAREVEFEPVDNILFTSIDDISPDDNFDVQLVGTVSNITADSFDLAGSTIAVTPTTIIDDSIIEAASGFEVDNEDTFGNLSFTLEQLLSDGMGVEVIVSQSETGLTAVSIEDL